MSLPALLTSLLSCSIILEDPYVYKPTLAWQPTAPWEVTVEALESVAWRGQT